MALAALLFLLCLPAFITGSPSKETKHGFKSNLHGNMKQYFKNYMAGNFIGAHEKKFDTKKVSKWSSEEISKRKRAALPDTAGSLSQRVDTLQQDFSRLSLANADLSVEEEEEIPTQASLVGKRAQSGVLAEFSLAEVQNALANADLSVAQVGEKELPANFKISEEIPTQASLVGKRAQSGVLAEFSLAEVQNALANADLSEAQVGEKQLPANFKISEEIPTQASLVGKRAQSGVLAEFSLAEVQNALANADLSVAQVGEKELPANFKISEEIPTQASLVGKRAQSGVLAEFSLAEVQNALANADLSVAKVAETLPTAELGLVQAIGKRGKVNEDILAWLRETSNLRKEVGDDIDSFFNSWKDILNILPGSCGEPQAAPVSAHNADLSLLGSTSVFMNLFWPFRFDVNVMNQRMAAYDLTQKVITGNETLKEQFFDELQDLQGIHLPVKANEIMFSFGDEDVVDGMNRSRLLPHSKDYVEAGKHLFTKDEQERILLLANKALDIINKTHPELYSAMVQMVSCITFFKNEDGRYRGGSITSALGLIWLDPRQDWTVPLMVEQIVHEFIHNSVYYAEFVHSAYRDISRLPEAKVMSAIRHEPRNYDKSLHAAYVSAGLITFHTRIGFLDRAAELAKTLPGAVQDLNRVNAEADVLDESGRAMLDFLTDYVCLARL